MIVTTKNKRPSFTAQCWIENGGSALANENAPTNLASVTAIATNISGGSRLIEIPKDLFLASGCSTFAASTTDGTSCIVRAWWYDAGKDLWVPNGATATLTTNAGNSATSVVGHMPGSKWFLQIVTNTGVKAIAFIIR